MHDPKRRRAGAVAVTAGTLSYSVTFSVPMTSANYAVTFCPAGVNLGSVLVWTSAKSTTGFTLNLSALLVGGSIDWIAAEYQ